MRCSVSVIVEENGKREQGGAGGGGRFDYAYFTDAVLERYAREAVHQAVTNLAAGPAPAGQMTVVLGNGWPGILLHEAIGHGLEGDFNRKGSSAFTGRIGQRVAAKGVTVIDDGTIPDRRGSLNIDDEGNRPSGPCSSKTASSGLHAGQPQRPPHGRCADRQRAAESFAHLPPAAHDQHRHAGRPVRSPGDHRLGQDRHLCRQFRRRPGGHHER